MRTNPWLFLFACTGFAFAMAVSLHGQDAPPKQEPVKPDGAGKPPTQAEVLEQMLRNERPPSSQALHTEAVRPEPPSPAINLAECLQVPADRLGPLVREDTLIFRQRAHLVRVGGAQKIPVLVFHSDTAHDPMRPMLVLPTRRLEDLEALQAKLGQDANFIVSGQVETYRGNNYLLLTRVAPMTADGNLE
jgi:hypothetical protein